jgi:hypothetical protein
MVDIIVTNNMHQPSISQLKRSINSETAVNGSYPYKTGGSGVISHGAGGGGGIQNLISHVNQAASQ